MSSERRISIRPESVNLLDYVVLDEQGRQGEYAMGRTLNVSKQGILMETHIPLSTGQQVMITLGLEERLVNIMGKIVYTSLVSGRYQNGIEFRHISIEDQDILDAYIAAFQYSLPQSRAGNVIS